MILTREDILKPRPERTEVLDVPELGGTIYLRVMTGEERDEWDRLGYDSATGRVNGFNIQHYRAQFAVRVIALDENGGRMFGPGDVAALSALPGPALERILGAGLVLNGMAGVSLKELEKNSETAPSDASGSA